MILCFVMHANRYRSVWTISLFQRICTAPMVVMFAISQDSLSILRCWSWKHQAGRRPCSFFQTADLWPRRVALKDITQKNPSLAVGGFDYIKWFWCFNAWILYALKRIGKHESSQWYHITSQRLVSLRSVGSDPAITTMGWCIKTCK